MKFLKRVDFKIWELVKKEEKRQRETLMMIPSENIASRAVEEAVGSCLGNKYAEGYPGRRYYQGQQFVDELESLVQERAKKLFGVPYVNVQPYSGSPANLAVYFAVLKPGEKIMGLSLSSGGHLTHGAQFNASSVFFKSAPYTVGEDGYIDYKALLDLAKKEKPKIIVAGTTAYPRILKWKKFRKIADEVGAYLMADVSHISGLIVGGAYPSPVPYVHIITTTTHKTLRGPRGAMIMVTEEGLKKDPELPKKIDKAIIPGLQGGPHLNTIAGIGVALKEASTTKFKRYAKRIVENAKALAEILKEEGFDLVTGGTDSHLILIDLRNKGVLGDTAAEGLEEANIIVNRNAIPFDPNPPFYPSGIRLGTPGITSRGMGKKESKKIGRLIAKIVNALSRTKKKLGIDDRKERKKSVRKEIIQKTKEVKEVKKEVLELCRKFPIKKLYI